MPIDAVDVVATVQKSILKRVSEHRATANKSGCVPQDLGKLRNTGLDDFGLASNCF